MSKPTAAAEQVQADADLTKALQEEQLASDLAVDEAADAAVAQDEAALDPSGSGTTSAPSSPDAGTGAAPSADASTTSTTDGSDAASSPAQQPDPPVEEQGSAPYAGETADEPNVASPVVNEVTNGVGDGDTSGGGGVPVTDPATNAPTDVVTPGGDAGADGAATPNPYDPTGGANAGTSVAPGQGDQPSA